MDYDEQFNFLMTLSSEEKRAYLKENISFRKKLRDTFHGITRSELVYMVENDLKERPPCMFCGMKPAKWFHYKYRRTCSKFCSMENKIRLGEIDDPKKAKERRLALAQETVRKKQEEQKIKEQAKRKLQPKTKVQPTVIIKKRRTIVLDSE